MSEIVFEQDGSSVTIEGHTSSTIDTTETTGVLEDGQAIEIGSFSTATTIEIPTTTVVTHHSNSVSKVVISTGDKGDQGEPGVGTPGTPGTDGEDGIAATIAVGTTTTGDPGTNAAVTNSGDTTTAIFNFTIPRGEIGETGPPGEIGLTGSVGPTGPPGPAGTDGAGLITGGTANQILVKQSGTDYDADWEDLIIETGKPTDAYAISNTEDATTYKYFGFENKDGAWYILRKTVATKIFLYKYGSSNYATGWTNRASHTYSSYESTF